MTNLIYQTEQNIVFLKETLKTMIDNRETIVNKIGEDRFKEKVGDVIMEISDMTQILLDNLLLN